MDMTESKVHEFKVPMTCGGCSSAVEKALIPLRGKGIEEVDIDVKNQLVKVRSTLQPEKVLELLKKTGKKVEYVRSS